MQVVSDTEIRSIMSYSTANTFISFLAFFHVKCGHLYIAIVSNNSCTHPKGQKCSIGLYDQVYFYHWLIMLHISLYTSGVISFWNFPTLLTSEKITDTFFKFRTTTKVRLEGWASMDKHGRTLDETRGLIEMMGNFNSLSDVETLHENVCNSRFCSLTIPTVWLTLMIAKSLRTGLNSLGHHW